MEYVGILIFFLVAVVIGLVMTLINDLLGPKTKERMEDYPYECGVPLYDPEARGTFKQGYYLLGLLIILFDIEAAFLFPWAVVFREIGLYGLVTALLFILILALGFAYAWKKGALRWQI
ncbi:NADH-ubiquinone/plastoquinone oxidoreductase chain 3 [Thermocrinis albus DSM 14484]|uniref:NADH-quinone oxidoreductase subunit A n=1 Tax=Thermocrinis albus (strain DSM 14484 / JCM 11386 / HI 11/12) TaxID=638303 RepID=D3SPC7_THEAH|nr:NADH-quinone oxidoreductase subunit A [Thermocrinis albus]ADC89014.1 NADH-ubiquinone/plastoquinone oxidoreductase chain 3 [Thermocrinis albus DSM 14484]